MMMMAKVKVPTTCTICGGYPTHKSASTRIMASSRKSSSKSKSRAVTSTCSASSAGGAPTWILVTAFIILALLALALVYQFMLRSLMKAPTQLSMSSSSSNEMFSSGDASSSSGPSRGTMVVYLYMDGCMWCDKFSPEWERFLKTQGDALSAAGITCAKIDGHADDKRVRGMDVKGYPTIVIIPAGAMPTDAIVFSGGSRSAETITQFVKDNVPLFSPRGGSLPP